MLPPTGYCSETFQILGTTAVPEPNSLSMLGSALLLAGLAGSCIMSTGAVCRQGSPQPEGMRSAPA
jgi:hypothetical protein